MLYNSLIITYIKHYSNEKRIDMPKHGYTPRNYFNNVLTFSHRNIKDIIII